MARLRLELLYFVQNRAMKNAVGVIFLTRYAANLIQGATGRLSRTVVIPHGIDSKFHRQKPERGWSENDDRSIRCIYVSNVAMYKNQRAVVRGIRELRARGHDLELLLVGGGDGPAYRMLKEEIAASDPDRRFVKMTGFVPHDELPGLIASADIFIFASGCETISITLLEGMAVGLPIACSNRGPMPEVLEDGGVYFDPVDPDSIAAAVEKLITNGDMRVSVARRAKELSRQYTWPRCAAETWNFIRTVAGR